MQKSFFITGTDTGVGKTFVACALARALKKRELSVGVMKPVETGCGVRNEELVPEDAVRLKEAASSGDPLDLISPYRFARPLAPSIAARLEGVTIDLAIIKKSFDELSARNDVLIVEGAGGLLVPLTEDKTMADLVTCLGIPLIVVAASRLGCLSHTLLTVGYAEKAGIEVCAVILNHPDATADESQEHNLEELKRFVEVTIIKRPGAPIIKELPFREEGELDMAWFAERFL